MARLNSTGLTGFSLVRTNGQATFSKPVLLDNVFNDNRAGTYIGGYVYGIGGTLPDGSTNSVDPWDMAVVGGPGSLHPVGGLVQTTTGTDGGEPTSPSPPHPGSRTRRPSCTVTVLAARTFPAFREAAIVTALLPPQPAGGLPPLGDGRGGIRQGPRDHDGHLRQPDDPWIRHPVERHRRPHLRGTSTTRRGRPSSAPARRFDSGSDQFYP